MLVTHINHKQFFNPLKHFNITAPTNILFTLQNVLMENAHAASCATSGPFGCSLRPVKPHLSKQLLLDCKLQGHTLFLISDISATSFNLIKEDPLSQELFTLFEKIILVRSLGHRHITSLFFADLITDYKLDPSCSIVIDNNALTLYGASQVGIKKHILAQNFDFEVLRKKLIQLRAL